MLTEKVTLYEGGGVVGHALQLLKHTVDIVESVAGIARNLLVNPPLVTVHGSPPANCS